MLIRSGPVATVFLAVALMLELVAMLLVAVTVFLAPPVLWLAGKPWLSWFSADSSSPPSLITKMAQAVRAAFSSPLRRVVCVCVRELRVWACCSGHGGDTFQATAVLHV